MLWIDGTGGATVGVLVLVFGRWLSDLYRLPYALVLFMAAANLLYGAYALSLARRQQRPMALIVLLALANGAWSLACVVWTLRYWSEASTLGLAHLLLEALFVGGLAIIEWRWRARLTARAPR